MERCRCLREDFLLVSSVASQCLSVTVGTVEPEGNSMSSAVPYTCVTKPITGVRRWSEEHGFRYCDETWTIISKGDVVVATFEEVGFEKAANHFCSFLNSISENDAEAVLQARANQAVQDHMQDLAKRRLTPSYNDGLPSRGFARL